MTVFHGYLSYRHYYYRFARIELLGIGLRYGMVPECTDCARRLVSWRHGNCNARWSYIVMFNIYLFFPILQFSCYPFLTLYTMFRAKETRLYLFLPFFHIVSFSLIPHAR
jgi:hypothetical protein